MKLITKKGKAMVTESRPPSISGCGWSRGLTAKGHEGLFFCILEFVFGGNRNVLNFERVVVT